MIPFSSFLGDSLHYITGKWLVSINNLYSLELYIHLASLECIYEVRKKYPTIILVSYLAST